MSLTLKRRLIPSDFLIHCFWAILTFSDQSICVKLDSNLSAYFVILKNHCSKSRFSTTELQRSHLPSSTCSSAKTVLQDGQKLTGAFLRYAKPALNN